jgi:hypothetical protein
LIAADVLLEEELIRWVLSRLSSIGELRGWPSSSGHELAVPGHEHIGFLCPDRA